MARKGFQKEYSGSKILVVKWHLLKVISVGNQIERMFEPRGTAPKQKIANHPDLRWQGQCRALAKKVIRILVHPTGS